MEKTCVATSSRCRFTRSTQTPANGARKKIGIVLAQPTTPSRDADELK
jgi:hypothetical protein